MDYLAPLGPVYQAGTLSGNPLAMAAGIAALEALCGLDVGRANPHPGPLPLGKGEGESPSAREQAQAATTINAPREAVPLAHRMGEGSGVRASVYARLEQLGAQLEAGMLDAAKSADVPVTFNRCGSMFCGYFTSEPVWNLADAMKADRERFKKFFHGMLDAGVYLAPSQFEAGFMSTAHGEADIEKTVSTAAQVMKGL
jgi:glutamate-1-semialdehyde aminotransferase